MQDLLQHPLFWSNVIFYGKVTGAVAAVSGALYTVVRFLWKTGSKISEVNNTVRTLATNHIPHLALAIDAHGVALDGLKQDMRDMDIKVTSIDKNSENTKDAIDTLSKSFIEHLQAASKEVVLDESKKVLKRKRK